MAIWQYKTCRAYDLGEGLQKILTENGGDNWRLHSIVPVPDNGCWTVVFERTIKEPEDSWAYNLMKSDLKEILSEINDKLSDIRVHASGS